MTQQQRAQIERAIEEYMPLYDQYLDESNEDARRRIKARMEEVERKYGFDGGMAS
ncbi:hypothetical protein J27TS7_57690 [Paenibacillus dendritiformis]|uniref:hypothetical protein n=1 Tax=Paenibacillus dendritiformis TaxID=130049 RepID=UPI001B12F56E|nr:hypothetical protein [Paenibacillus dendritiformis]GIO76255.1 hypothetical protein J27TS7_57690 [Paenibacillus dendritiformis]